MVIIARVVLLRGKCSQEGLLESHNIRQAGQQEHGAPDSPGHGALHALAAVA